MRTRLLVSIALLSLALEAAAQAGEPLHVPEWFARQFQQHAPLPQPADAEGTVVLAIAVNQEGEVTRAAAVSGDPALAAAAAAVVGGWRFSNFLVSAAGWASRVSLRFQDDAVAPAELPEVPDAPGRYIQVPEKTAAARLVHRVTPRYPVEARQARIQGAVRLQLLLGTDGGVVMLRVLQGHPMLGAAARDAVRQWRYVPFEIEGETVEAETEATVTFTLEG